MRQAGFECAHAAGSSVQSKTRAQLYSEQGFVLTWQQRICRVLVYSCVSGPDPSRDEPPSPRAGAPK